MAHIRSNSRKLRINNTTKLDQLSTGTTRSHHTLKLKKCSRSCSKFYLVVTLLFCTLLYSLRWSISQPVKVNDIAVNNLDVIGQVHLEASASAQAHHHDPALLPTPTNVDQNSGTKIGWLQFLSQKHDTLEPFTPTSQRLFSPLCALNWVTQGTLCQGLSPALLNVKSEIEIIVTFVNGSDSLHRLWKSFAKEGKVPPLDLWNAKTGEIVEYLGKGNGHEDVEKDFRSHNEILYALRSLYTHLDSDTLDRLTLITTDVPSNPSSSQRLGQIPHWFPTFTTSLKLIHHSQFFKFETDQDVFKFLPTFNSYAIESQFPHLPFTKDLIFYLNDDMLILNRLSFGDLGSVLYGPVFRLDFTRLIGTKAFNKGEENTGEFFTTLSRTNSLLDKRFGRRKRLALEHVPKVLPRVAMEEVSKIWSEELEQTARVRFRGKNPMINFPLLVTHYHIEKHREILLWSFFNTVIDTDRNEFLDFTERQTLLKNLKNLASSTSDKDKVEALNFTKPQRDVDYHFSSGTEPRMTIYTFTSMHGFPFTQYTSTDVPTCQIRLNHCFGSEYFTSHQKVITQSIFKRVTFEKPECGDCLITFGILKSENLLSGFLTCSTNLVESDPSLKEADPGLKEEIFKFGMEKDWSLIDFSPSLVKVQLPSSLANNIEGWIGLLLMRYSYILGKSSMEFIKLDDTTPIEEVAQKLINVEKRSTFLTINDNFSSKSSVEIGKVYETLYSHLDFLYPLPWELR